MRSGIWLALILGLAIAALLAASVLALRPAPVPARYDYQHVHHFDPEREGGHLLPNLDLLVSGEHVGQSVRFVTNSAGFRDTREFAYRPDPGTTRILFLGDSYVDGMRTDQERTIGYRLEALLDEAGDRQRPEARDYEVLISGHTCSTNAWYYVQEHGRRYHPQVVLLGVTLGNDITWHNYGAGFRPVRGASGHERLELALPLQMAGRNQPQLMLPADAYDEPGPWDALVDLEFRVRSGLARRSGLFSQSVSPLIKPRGGARGAVPAADFMVSLGLFYTPVMPEIEQMYRDFENTLAGLHALALREEARLFVVLFPVRAQVSERDWRLLVRRFGLDSDRFDLEYPGRRILDFCRARGIACLDALLALREAERAAQGPLYRPRGDMHLSDRGQEVTARAIASWLSVSSGERVSEAE
jgi:hypothetical protein